MQVSYNVESDQGFRTDLEGRKQEIDQIISEILHVPYIDDTDHPGAEVNPPPNEQESAADRAEFLNLSADIKDLCDGFADASVEHAGRLVVHLELTDERLNRINFGSATDGPMQQRVDRQLEGQVWTGDGADLFQRRLTDLILAVASQQEIVRALHGAMRIHWGLLCTARAKVLAIMDSLVRALREELQESQNEIGTLLKTVFEGVRKSLGELDIVETVVKGFSEGPASVLKETANKVVIDNVGVVAAGLGEVLEADDKDLRSALHSAIEKVRDVRRATHEDSVKFADIAEELDPYFATGNHVKGYVVHEVGSPLPDADNIPDSDVPFDHGGVLRVHPSSLVTIADEVIGDVRFGVDNARLKMAEAAQEHGLNQSEGANPFSDTRPTRVPGLRMFEEFEASWSMAREGLELAMTDTVAGMDDLAARLRQAAEHYQASDLTHRDTMARIAADFAGLGSPTPDA